MIATGGLRMVQRTRKSTPSRSALLNSAKLLYRSAIDWHSSVAHEDQAAPRVMGSDPFRVGQTPFVAGASSLIVLRKGSAPLQEFQEPCQVVRHVMHMCGRLDPAADHLLHGVIV